MRYFIVLGQAFVLAAGSVAAQTTTPPAAQPKPEAVTTSPATPTIASPTTTETAVPTELEPGANSFTEGQARSRLEHEGVVVGGLAKDNSGVWRGQGTKDGKTVQVAIDFKGNIIVR